MNNKLTLLRAPAVFFCWCFFLMQGCKEPAIEDTHLLTSDDELNLAKDTLHLKVFSEFVEPVYSYAAIQGVLGTITDANFGTTYAGFYTQCKLPTNNLSFGVNPVLDSVVLSLRYSSVYGKFDQPVTVSVYELSQSIYDSVKYKSTDAFAVNIPPIGERTGFTPNLTDSITAMDGVYPPHLRVKLNDAFGTKIITADSIWLSNTTNFFSFMKGIYVTTSSSASGNGTVSVDLLSAVSGINLYFHNDSIDSVHYVLPLAGARVNHIDNIYTGGPAYTSVHNPDVINGEEKMYLEGGAGVKGKIVIKDLDSLEKKIAINKAELILSQSAADTQYLAPLDLYIYRIDDAGEIRAIDDYGISSPSAARTTETVNGKTINRYHFSLKKYFQKLLQGVYNNNGFYVMVPGADSNCERVVISNSSTDEDYSVILRVTYTKL